MFQVYRGPGVGAKSVDILNIQTYPGMRGGSAGRAGRAKKPPGWGAYASDDFLPSGSVRETILF